jgi:hypothetical protein
LFLHDLAAPAESAAFIFIFRRIHTALPLACRPK